MGSPDRAISLDPRKCHGRAQPRCPPSAEHSGDEPAADREQDCRRDSADCDRRGEVYHHVVRVACGQRPEPAGEGRVSAAAATVEAAATTRESAAAGVVEDTGTT